jgi:polyribonucleotide nucleotidyltransferase
MTKLEKTIAGRKLTIETGRMAKQAHGAVYVEYGESAVLVAATSEMEPKDLPFFPLTIEYRERTYAAGKIPGGFFKREGRPSDKEVLTARMIDRPLRPLFPKGYMNETQVYCLALSSDGENDPALLGMIGASASLMVSDIPWDGPVSPIKVGRVDGDLVLNPTTTQMEESDLELIVSVKGGDVVMMEGHAEELPEDVVLEAIEMAVEEASRINEMQEELARTEAPPKRDFTVHEVREGLQEAVTPIVEEELAAAYGRPEKQCMPDAIRRAKERINEELADRFGADEDEKLWKKDVSICTTEAEKGYVRRRLLEDRERYDGRRPDQVRQITCEVGLLPRTHGSAMFTRGETQALVATTLGGARDEQRVDALLGEYQKSFMLHYNFPPFSVGECRPIRGPGRREKGHGNLAETALRPVMPEDFNYTVRVVSDILESNGSSSQATVCGGSLCLMDAGVPIARHVAGIALGLVTDGDSYIVLSDIAGAEDHLGDMDLKIAGSDRGITAIQMDLKVEGISRSILREAFEQSRDNRMEILKCMTAAIESPRESLSPHAPRITTVQVDKEKIGKIIGPGGKNIRRITDESGAEVNIDDDGVVTVLSTDAAAAEKAVEMIEACAGKVKVGKVYHGKVVSVMNYGAFVELVPGTDGLVHVSEMKKERVRHPSDVVSMGDEVWVKVKKVRDDGKIDLTMKGVSEEEKA